MSNRTIAAVQLVINGLFLIVLAGLYVGIALAMAGFFYLPGPDNEPIASWWFRVAQNIPHVLSMRPEKILVILFALAYAILVVWLCKKHSKESKPPFWVYFLSGVLPGFVMMLAWAGIENAHEIKAAKTQVSVNRTWVFISSIAGGISFLCVCTLVWLSFLPGGDFHDSLFAGVLVGLLALSLFLFFGFNYAVQFASPQSTSTATPADPATREAWAATWEAWKAGRYDSDAQKEADKVSVTAFIGANAAYNRLVAAVTQQRPFDAGEFIVAASPRETFLLTNMTLYLFPTDNPLPNPALVIPLHEIEEYRFEKEGRGRVILKLSSGKTLDCATISAPNAGVVNRFSTESRAIQNTATE